MDKYIECFENYIKSFNLTFDALKMKKDHTYRVMNFCDKLAKDLNLNEQEIFIANLIGLFHDIGRFYQYSKFHNFRDYENIDHADYGIEILCELGILDSLKEKNLIIKAIQNHNKYTIEKGLSEKENMFCKIIRDADKLDILKLVVEGRIKLKSFNEEYSKEAVNELLSGHCLTIKNYSRLVDKSLVNLGLVNDMHYNYSKKYILNNHILEGIVEKFKESNPQGIEDLDKIKEKLEERLGK